MSATRPTDAGAGPTTVVGGRASVALGVPPEGAEPAEQLVDVVVPTFGAGRYLRQALRSILDQTHTAWRLTICDNSPETGAAAAAYRELGHDPRIRYIATGGLSQADNWNVAFRSGDAPFVAMLHDDDYWDPTFLAPRVGALMERPECAYAFSGYRQVDADGREVALRPLPVPGGVLEPRVFVPIEYVANIISPGTVLYRRSALDADGTGFRAVPFTDYEFWLRLACRSPVYGLDLLDYANRLHSGSVTSSMGTAEVRRTGQLWVDFLDVVEPAIEEALPGVLTPDLRRKARAGALLTSALDELQAGDRREAARRLQDALRCRAASVFDVRVPPILVLLVLAPRFPRWLTRLRALQHGRQIPAHPRDVPAYVREHWKAWRYRRAQQRSAGVRREG